MRVKKFILLIRQFPNLFKKISCLNHSRFLTWVQVD